MRGLYTGLTLLVLLASMLMPLAATTAQAQTVLKITTSRDAWGNIWYNQYFYVDILLSSKAGTTITLKVQKNDEAPIEINATYKAGTAYLYRVWFEVDSSGLLKYATSSSDTPPTTWTSTGITLEEGDVLKISYQTKSVELSFVHKTAEQKIRLNVPYPAYETGTYDWYIAAPDLNKNPAAPDVFVAYVEIQDYTKNLKAYLAVPYKETGTNTGVFKPVAVDGSITGSETNKAFGSEESLNKLTITAPGKLYNGTELRIVTDASLVASYDNTTKIIDYTLKFTVSLVSWNASANSPVETIASYEVTYEGEINTAVTNITSFKVYVPETNKAIEIASTLEFTEFNETHYNITYSYSVKLTYEYAYAMARPYIADQLEPTDYIVVMFTVPRYQGATKGDVTTAKVTVFRTAGEISETKADIRTLYVKVSDSNENKRSYAKDYVSVCIRFPNGVGKPLTLTETDVDTGEFVGTLPLASYYVNKPIEGLTVPAFNATMFKLTITYVDPSEGTERTVTVVPEFHKAELSVEPSQVSLAGVMKITIKDADLNLHTDTVDTFVTTLSSGDAIEILTYVNKSMPQDTLLGKLVLYAIDDKGVKHLLTLTSSHTFVIYETEANSGIFEVVIPLSKINTTGLVITKLLVVYTDMLTPEGPKDIAVEVPIAKVSLSVDRDTVPLTYKYPVKIRVTVVDPSANQDAYKVDYLPNPVVWKLCTAGGEVVPNGTGQLTSLPETDVNTGVFSGIITLPADEDIISPKLINGKLCISYTSVTGETVEVEIPLKVYGVALNVSATTAKYGDQVKITLKDPDANIDTKVKDEVTVYVNGKPVTLKESDTDSGVFEGVITIVGKDVSGVANPVVVDPGDTIVITYEDKTSPITPRDAKNWTSETVATKIYIPPHTGKLVINNSTETVEVGPTAKLYIKVEDWDLNLDPTAPDEAVVYLRKAGLPAAEIHLKETGDSTGVFEAELTIDDIAGLLSKASGKTINVTSLIGETMYFVYRDEITATGEITTFSVPVKVITWDGKVLTDKDAYNPGEKIKITVIDKDLDADTVTVRVTSTSDNIGTPVTLVRVAPGVYTGEVLVTDKPTVESGYIYAKIGDTVTITYIDHLPAGYPEVQDKPITKTVTIGVRPKLPAKVKEFELVNPLTGETLAKAKVGQLVSLQVNVENHDIVKRTMTVMAIVRDANGVTVYIAYSVVTLEPGQSITVGLGWTPTEPGTYTVEIQVVKSLKEPVGLAELAHYTITVEQA